ncbi:MAG: TonB-dependent receptor [Hyphomicrobium sp.]|jgi:outer membrane receptor protein involved in Fe transport
MRFVHATVAFAAAIVALSASNSTAQESPAPAPATEQLPPVEVIQKKAAPAPTAPKKAAAKKKKPAPVAAAPASVQPVAGTAVAPSAGSVGGLVQIAPLPGSEIPIDQIPRGVSTMNSSDIRRDGSVIPQEFLNSRIPSVMVDDLQGNQFQTGIQYRGFEASPVNGLPQGLAVYQNGVRINEAFGDTVNWDFLPSNAIDGIAVMGANPIYGLNAIGGAIGITMKDGFGYHGAEVDTRAGSFGRRQVGVQAGAQSGNIAIYGAFEGINDDGFRDFSDTEERRGYFDLGFKGTDSEFHLNYTGAQSHVGVTAAVPEELLDFGGRERTFTSPQITDSDMQMFSANGKIDVTPTTTVSGVAYHRNFRQSHIDGNISEFSECGESELLDDPSQVDTELCSEDGQPIFGVGGTPLEDNSGKQIGTYNGDPVYSPLGSIDKTGQDAESWGVALQAADKSRLFGLGNHFVVGSSYDHGNVKYRASSELGYFLDHYVVQGLGTTLTGQSDLATGQGVECEDEDDPVACDALLNASAVTPRSLTTTNDYVGIYAVDTLELTDKLSLTFGGRWNYARVEIENTGDPSLDKLNGINEFYRFNPSVGLTYKLLPGMSVYGGYSEANRAPTASEIACSDPENPCIIESALASDPPLKQVVSKTWEAGVRGELATWNGTERLDWSFGVFRATNENDIIMIADSQQGRGYFANAGETLRQGIEASATYRAQRWMGYVSYSFVDATFQTANIIAAENNPKAEECEDLIPGFDGEDEATCVAISAGDRMPGVPRHRFKAGLDYLVTPKWVVGADFVAASNQIFFGDESNLDTPLGGYGRVNVHSSYNVTEHVQLYGLIENLFDAQYGIYGTYINRNLAQQAGPGCGGGNDDADNCTGTGNGPDPSLNGLKYDDDNRRTITPAIPFAAYGGIRVKF